jgi:O-succinylbenzoic acid--CoA ligase
MTSKELIHQTRDAAVSLVLQHEGGPDLGVGSLDLADLVAGPRFRAEPPHADTPHSVFYTSGTGGHPKGVILTWANFEAAAGASAQLLEHDSQDTWLAVLPVYHIGGFSILVRSARQGGAVILDSFDPRRAVAQLRSGRVSLVSMVPTMLDRVLAVDRGPFPGLRAVLLGGGPIPAALLTRAATGHVPVLPSYGLTEAASQVATVPLANALAGHRAAQPVAGMEVRVVDEESRDLPPDERGRIQIRGAAVSPGYLHEPARPVGSWFTTGDLGVLDGEGNLTVLGRADDVIITGGENVHPVEVEAVIEEHPDVAAALVYGVQDAKWGQVVVADVVGSEVSEGDLDLFLRSRLAGYKIPRRWRFVAAIPLNALGKKARSYRE